MTKPKSFEADPNDEGAMLDFQAKNPEAFNALNPKPVIPTYSLAKETPIRSLDNMSELELFGLYEEVKARLPKPRLAKIDVLNEALLAHAKAKLVEAQAAADKTVPYNQKAQVLNTLSATIKALGALQNNLYDSERVKAIEQTIIGIMRDMPKELKDTFFEVYEPAIKALEESGVQRSLAETA